MTAVAGEAHACPSWMCHTLSYEDEQITVQPPCAIWGGGVLDRFLQTAHMQGSSHPRGGALCRSSDYIFSKGTELRILHMRSIGADAS